MEYLRSTSGFNRGKNRQGSKQDLNILTFLGESLSKFTAVE
jgi:hypothetical protein